MTAQEKIIVKKFKSLVSKKIPLHQVILFGSRARGDADPDSDMDILVVSEYPLSTEQHDYVSEAAWEAGFKYGLVIVPVVYSLDEWENGPEHFSLLARAVAQEGIEV